jgi:hypothetical protein
LLDAFAVPLEDLAASVRNRLAALLTGPGSLTAIRTALGRIADLVQGLDLEFLRTSLRALFDDIGSRLDAVSPQKLAKALDESFGAVLDAITIDLVLPKADMKQLDDTYAAVVDKLRLLDPATIVADVVKPLFEEKVVPLIDNFDIAPFLDTIIEKLGGLDDGLRAELKRVNDAYRKLLAALPEGSNQGAGVSVSVAA